MVRNRSMRELPINSALGVALSFVGFVLIALALVVLQPGSIRGQSSNPPPFDFSDSFYLQNGIDPSKILNRVGSSTSVSAFVVDNSNTDPDRRNIRVIETIGGFDHAGSPLYSNVFGLVNPNTFTNDAAGQNAMSTANSFSAFIFPKASGNPLSPALSNLRQDKLFDTRSGSFVQNPLGLWTLVFVSFTPAAFNTAEGQMILAALTAKNGTDLDGTPIITKATEVEDLQKQGLVLELIRNRDGSQGFPWIIGPALKDPRGGAIARDAFLDFVRRPDGTPLAPNLVTQFNCLQSTGMFCP